MWIALVIINIVFDQCRGEMFTYYTSCDDNTGDCVFCIYGEPAGVLGFGILTISTLCRYASGADGAQHHGMPMAMIHQMVYQYKSEPRDPRSIVL